LGGMIPDEVVDRIASQADIVEIIGEYVQLRKGGANHKGLCPFHEEKTPSFMVSPTKQIFKCFGCGAGGNVFQFLMKREGLTFPEAVELLGERLGIEVPRRGRSEDGKSQDLYDALEWAAAEFQKALAHPKLGRKVRAYLEGRGISAGSTDAFRLGYAPGGGGWLIAKAKGAGIPLSRLRTAGLVVGGAGAGDGGGHGGGVWDGDDEPRDRFIDRLLFPIANAAGKIVGFGGRSLGSEGYGPKYLNSPETPVYTKSFVLYGLDKAKGHIRREGRAVLVEGYMDLLRCVEAGLTNVVASCGTALTTDHARLLRRYGRGVRLLYDGDEAGLAAASRGLDVLVAEGLTVHVTVVPDGLDPDDYVAAHGAEALKTLVEDAANLVDFRLDMLGRKHNAATVDGRVAILEELLPTLALMPSASERDAYAKRVAESLGIGAEAIAADLERARGRDRGRSGRRGASRRGDRGGGRDGASSTRQRRTGEGPDEARTVAAASPSPAERELLRALVHDRELIERAREIISAECMETHQGTCLLLAVLGAPDASEPQLLGLVDDENGRGLLAELLTDEPPEGTSLRMFEDCAAVLQKRAVGRRIAQRANQLRESGLEPLDDTLYRELLRRQHELSKSAKVSA